MQDQLAAPFAGGSDFNRRAEPLGQFILEPRQVPVALLPAARCRRAQQPLHQRLGLAHGKLLRADARAELDLPRGVQCEQRPRVPHLDCAAHEHVLHRARELEETQEIGRGAARAADRVGRLLVRHLEFIDQALHARRLFHRIQVFALDVLDERHYQCRIVRHLAHYRGHLRQPGDLRRAPAALTSDELIAAADGAHDYGLEQALRADPNTLEVLFVEGPRVFDPIGAWMLALSKSTGPSMLSLGRDPVGPVPNTDRYKVAKGAYVVKEADKAQLTLASCGTNLHYAVAAAEGLSALGIPTRQRVPALGDRGHLVRGRRLGVPAGGRRVLDRLPRAGVARAGVEIAMNPYLRRRLLEPKLTDYRTCNRGNPYAYTHKQPQ